METILIKAIQLIVALSLLVVVHEFGHYFFARLFGIRVEKFFMFFNPRFSLLRYLPEKGRLELFTWMDKKEQPHPLFSFKAGQDYEKTGNKVPAWKRTIYGIGWIPLGGYCAIAGMIDETQGKEKLAAEPQPWEFRSKPAWQRLLVMCGGVIFNFIAAILIYIGMTFTYGEKCVKFRDAYAGMAYSEAAHRAGFVDGDIPLMADGREVEATDTNPMLDLMQAKVVTVLRNGTDTVHITLPDNFIGEISEDEAFFGYRQPVVIGATDAGKPGDKAGLLPGDRIISVGDVATPSFTDFKPALAKYAGKETTLRYIRQGDTITVRTTPTDEGLLGVQIAPLTDAYPVYIQEYDLIGAIPVGAKTAVSTLTGYVTSLGSLFKDSSNMKQLGGFGRLGNMFPDHWNWYSFWYFTAFLSVALAFMNILPIPALDGGHVLFLLAEVVTRRRLPDRFMEMAQQVGFFLLLALLLFANFNDIIYFLK